MNIASSLAFANAVRQQQQTKESQLTMNCPLCGCKSLEYHLQGETHMYVCSECPFVGFEHYDYNNVLDILDRYLGVLENCNKDTLMIKLLQIKCDLKKGKK